MRNILRRLPGTRSRSKTRRAEDRAREEAGEADTLDTEHLRVPRIDAGDLKVATSHHSPRTKKTRM